jgi:hypothetical protein
MVHGGDHTRHITEVRPVKLIESFNTDRSAVIPWSEPDEVILLGV